MTYADKPLDQNPLWNAAYHLRFAYEYMVTARVLDTARQSSSHYERMARKSLEEAAEALGLTLVEKPATNVSSPAEALIAAETMLAVLPETNTNWNGERPSMTTRKALALVRKAIGPAAEADDTPARVTVVTLPYAKVAQ